MKIELNLLTKCSNTLNGFILVNNVRSKRASSASIEEKYLQKTSIKFSPSTSSSLAQDTLRENSLKSHTKRSKPIFKTCSLREMRTM
jgi:hypothetical protein